MQIQAIYLSFSDKLHEINILPWLIATPQSKTGYAFLGGWGRALLYSPKNPLTVTCSLSFTRMLNSSEKKGGKI